MSQYIFEQQQEVSKDVLDLVNILLEGNTTPFDGNDTIYISREDLSEKLGKSTRTVSRLLKKAEEQGVLTSERKQGRGGHLIIQLSDNGKFSFPIVDNPVTSPSTHSALEDILGVSATEESIQDIVQAPQEEEEKPKKKVSERRKKAEMRKVRAMQALQTTKEENYNRKLLKRDFINQQLTWDFFKTSFGEDAEDTFGAYLMSRLYNAYLKATTTEMRKALPNFRNKFEGYESLPLVGAWFGTANFVQFRELYREAKRIQKQVSSWALISVMFDTYLRRAIFKNNDTGKGYAPYPKNLRMSKCLDNMNEVIKRINDKYRQSGNKFRVTFDTLRINTFGSIECLTAGQALEDFLASVLSQEEPTYVRYMREAGNEIREQFLSKDYYTYSEVVETRLDWTLRNYHLFVENRLDDVKGLTKDEKEVVLEYIQEWIYLKRFGIDTDFAVLVSPAMDKVHNAIRMEFAMIDHDERLTYAQKEKKKDELLFKVLPDTSKGQIQKYSRCMVILRNFYQSNTDTVQQFVRNMAVSKQQYSGYTAIDKDLLATALPKVKHLLALDRFGIPEWEHIAQRLVDPYFDPSTFDDEVPDEATLKVS